MKEFDFFLEAYHYCRKHDIPLESIVRKNWKTWIVEIKWELVV